MDKENIIKDNLTKICVCKGVSKGTIKSCIKNGSSTLEDIKKNTGAMTGGCKGARCKSKIQELLDNKGEI